MKQTQALPNIVRHVIKIERMAETPMSNDEYLHRVWYEDVEGEFANSYYKDYYEYVWAIDEMQAYKRVMTNAKTKHDED